MKVGNETFEECSNILYNISDFYIKYQLKGVKPEHESEVYNSPETNLFIISHINCKLFIVFSLIIILLIKTSVLGFLKIGINSLPKKNFAKNIIFSASVISGNFCLTKRIIILLKHFIEYGNK